MVTTWTSLVEPDFMSKIRKRRETSADITVLRKGSGTVTDLKSDITRYVLISNSAVLFLNSVLL